MAESKDNKTRNLPKIVPERIREAREANGYTSESFAEVLGVSRQAIGQYEIGQTTPSPEIFREIISLTGQPPSFFTTQRKRNSELFRRPFWRALKRMHRNDRSKIKRRLEWAYDIVPVSYTHLTLPTKA